jgi:uncharacterized protein (TIGR02453 family)
MNAKLILSFLKDVEKNNNREWFHANKERYEEAKKEFETFINALIPEIIKFDKSIINLTAKDCVFRIYNDVRFAKNKLLYKSNMGAYIARGGKNRGYAGYYFHIENDNCFLGGGIYMPSAENLKLIRQEIYYNFKEISGILSSKSLQKYFKMLDDFKVSRVPKEFPKDAESAELLKYKGYTVLSSLEKKQLLSDDLIHHVAGVFKTLTPLNNFLNRALFVPQE